MEKQKRTEQKTPMMGQPDKTKPNSNFTIMDIGKGVFLRRVRVLAPARKIPDSDTTNISDIQLQGARRDQLQLTS